MSKPDKHTPLTTEELFKLLDDTSGKATDFDELDEFEKDALEGFAMHSSPQKARAMVSEVNTIISQKAAGIEKKETKKNKVIWFSAAASIVLLILLSVFFLNQTKKDSASNIALNETKSTTTQDITTVSPSVSDESPAEPVLESAIEKKPDASASKQKPGGGAVSGKSQADEQSLGTRLEEEFVMAEKAAFKNKEEVAAEISNTAVEGYTTARSDDKAKEELKQATVSDKLEAAKPVSAATEAKDQTVAYNTTAGTTAAAPTVVLSKNADAKYDNRNEKSSVKKRSKAEQSPSYSSNESDLDAVVEHAIRDFVIANKNEKSLTLVGKYKVKAIVHANGRLRVTSVVQLTKETCDKCTEAITKALNTMTGWTPATWDNKPTASTAEFVLEF